MAIINPASGVVTDTNASCLGCTECDDHFCAEDEDAFALRREEIRLARRLDVYVAPRPRIRFTPLIG